MGVGLGKPMPLAVESSKGCEDQQEGPQVHQQEEEDWSKLVAVAE